MEVTPELQHQLDRIDEKYKAINQNTETHLEGCASKFANSKNYFT